LILGLHVDPLPLNTGHLGEEKLAGGTTSGTVTFQGDCVLGCVEEKKGEKGRVMVGVVS